MGLVFATLGGAFIAATPAVAHAVLVDSTPGPDEELDEVPTEVVLVFNEPIQGDFTQVAVLANDVNHEVGDPEIDGEVVTQAVDELAPGEYLITFRVGSADGHPVTGAFEFTVLEGATPAPVPAESPEPEEPSPTRPTTATPTPVETPTVDATAAGTPTPDPTPAAAADDASLLPLWLAAAAAGLVAVTAVVLTVRRRPGGEQDGMGADTGP